MDETNFLSTNTLDYWCCLMSGRGQLFRSMSIAQRSVSQPLSETVHYEAVRVYQDKETFFSSKSKFREMAYWLLAST